MNSNYSELSESELTSMIDDAQKALKERHDSKRKDVVNKINELAASINVNVDITEITKPMGKKGSKVPVKYQNPQNLSQKWTGRGMKPKWLQALLDEGREITEFELGV